ncbi:MAG TPA: ABC transporter permease [Thermoanaerobaculia bacterium]
MGALWQDVRHAFRRIRKNPGFAAVTIGVLALGIGANTAIFSVVDAVLVKPLPFPDSDRLVSVPHVPPPEIFPGHKTFSVSPANYLDWKAQNGVFDNMTIFAPGSVTLTGSGPPEPIRAGFVSADFFTVLGVRPLAGRLFAPGDDEPGRYVAVLSEELWKRRFGGDPAAVGRTFIADAHAYTIVGVLPAGRGYPAAARVWLPLAFTAKEKAIRGIHDFDVLARVRRGVSVEAARAQMNAISARLAARYPEDDKGWGAAVIPLHEDLVGDVRTALLVLLGAVAFVLLIACANVANLVLAKTLGRRKEIAVRTALGASRGRIVRKLFAETGLLALCGGAAGLGVAGVGSKLITSFLGSRLPRVHEIRLDASVLLFTLAVSLLTGALAGALPAWRLTRANPNDALKEGGRAGSDAGSPVLRGALVTIEVALALMLMFGAGLLVRSLGRLRGVDPGFDPRNVLRAQLSIPQQKYPASDSQRRFYEQALGRVRALPGVKAAGAISTLPLTDGGSTQPIAVEGRPAASMSDQPEVAVRVMTPGTLAALGIPVRRGRDFTDADTERSPGVILVTESMAKKFWPGEDAVGKRLTLTFYPGVSREVVGVIGDVKLRGLAHRDPIAALFVPHGQIPLPDMELVARTTQDPRLLGPSVDAAVHALDPDLAVVDVGTMEEYLGTSLSEARFNMQMLAVFAALALVLSAVGIYSVLAYAVRSRTREIGIRMALGAEGARLVRMVVFQGMRPALIGLAIGIIGSLALGRLLSTLLFGVATTDFVTFASVSALLAAVALAACAVPAWRATRVAPTTALQEG